MSSRSRTDAGWLATGVLLVVALAGCHKQASEAPGEPPAAAPAIPGVVTSALSPGQTTSLVTDDPKAAAYYDNADAVNTGMRLFKQYNCNGCHSSGGGGMGVDLMDGQWIYGGRLTQIHQTLVEGRPNGMPSWGGKVPDDQLWDLAAYVRSLSLPATLAANTGDTPGQRPAPVPRDADAQNGWNPPPSTTNDFTATTGGK